MHGLIKAALRHPIAVVVGMLAIVIFSTLSIRKISVDIFPELDLPTIYVIQPYGGMAPDQLDGFVAAQYQNLFQYVTGVRNIEIKSTQGLALLKLSFYPGTNMGQAASEVTTNANRARAYMPDGTVPPQIVRFDASSVPVGQLVFNSSTHSLNEIQDYAASRIRPMFSTIPGVASPPPFGGNQRTVVVRVDPSLLRSYNLTPDDVVDAISDSNQPSAAGNVRIGKLAYMSPVNSLIQNVSDFLDVPIRKGNGPNVYVRDVGTVADGADITVSYALVNGKRAIYIPVVKKADASTLDVVKNVRNTLPALQAAVPEDVKLSYEFDQSVYVVEAVKNLISEGILGAVLTGLMVYLFLRDLRSVLIVVVTIPLAILSAVLMLDLWGQTINTMTLSGLALAIGVLVDEATVTIENIHQHLETGKAKGRAIWDACKEIALPKLLILLCILAVFAPSFLMEGIPKSMFLPLSLAVGFAMIASFLLSQTLVPVLANWLMKSHKGHATANHAHEDETPEVEKIRLENQQIQSDARLVDQHGTDTQKVGGFEKFRVRYTRLVERIQPYRKVTVLAYLSISLGLVVFGFSRLGTDILPKANTTQFQMRLREPDGTRLEVTERATRQALKLINEIVGPEHVRITSAYVGTVPSSYGTSSIFVYTSGFHEAIIQVALHEDYHVNNEQLKEKIRARVAREMPDTKISFEPIELTEKIMSQGASTPIEVTVGAKNIGQAHQFAKKVVTELQAIPYLRDVQIAQPLAVPTLSMKVDRVRAAKLNMTAEEVSQSMVAATSSSRFTERNLWIDPKSGLGYQVQVTIPEYLMNSVSAVENIPIKYENGNRHILADVASVSTRLTPGEIDREGPNRLVTVTANIVGKDLGTAGAAVRKAVDKAGEPPRGVVVKTKGQIQLLADTLNSLQTGLAIAIVVIFLLLAANFESFKLSLVVLSTVPAVLAGSLLMLLACKATLNLQSYMGMIMSVGVSVSNALLLVTNAEQVRLVNGNASWAARMAANTRLRPILMTAIAMIAGMIPMASGVGEGGDQVAPLGQAVIGGLLFSTVAALLILPNTFAWVQGKSSLDSTSLDPDDENSQYYHQEHALL
jgi:multidrug efflux pump subunit AcrB